MEKFFNGQTVGCFLKSEDQSLKVQVNSNLKMTNRFPEIRDLAVIGDRCTSALITTLDSVVQRDRAIVDAALACANDLGFFAEEADPQTKQMLGNFSSNVCSCNVYRSGH